MQNLGFRRNLKFTIDKATSLSEIRRAPKQLAAGFAIMLFCSIAGAAILTTQNQTENLLVLNRDVSAGDVVSPEYFEIREVLVSTLNSQWLKSEQIKSGSYFAISLSKGDALRAADISKISSDLRLVSFAVEETDLPVNLKPGDQVDFWEVEMTGASLLATDLAVQSVSLKESRGVYQLGLLANSLVVEDVLRAIETETFRLVISL